MNTVSALPRVIGVSLLVAGVAYAGTFLIHPVYESEELLYFPQSQSGNNPLAMLKPGGADVDAGAVRLMNGVLVSPLVGAGAQTAAGIVTSNTAIRTCVDELNLDKSWKMTKSEAYAKLADWASAKVDKNGMLNVSTKAQSPDEAVQILGSLRKFLDKRSTELTINVSRSNRKYLEQRVINAERDVNRIQQDLVSTMQSSPMADVSDLMKAYLAAKADLQKAEVEQAAGEAKLKLLEQDSKRLVAGNPGGSDLMTLESVAEGAKKLGEELQTRRLALADAFENFTQDSPEYKNAVRSMKTAEDLGKQVLDASQQKVEQGLTPDLIVARSELGALRGATARSQQIIHQYERLALQAPRQFAAVERMKMEFDSAMTAYGLLRQQLELAKLAESRDPSRFAVIDEAFPNPKPVAPRRALISGVIFMVAALFQLALMSLKSEPEDEYYERPSELNGHSRKREVPRVEEPEPTLRA